MPLVVGVDSSTQATKVEARDLRSGELRATGRSAHPATLPPVSEQDPQSWWDALVAAFAQLGEWRSDVVAMSVGAQQHGLVLVDDRGTVLRPAKLWNDTTSAPQAEVLVQAMGADRWAEACGSVPVAAFTVTKLAWVAEHEPAVLEATARIMLPHDYLTWRLTGEHVTDRGDASGTGWFDPASCRYRPELLHAAVGERVEVAALPRVLGPEEAAGRLVPEAAAELGLSPTVLVAAGTGDNMAAALGLGLQPGDVALSLGTSGTVYAVSHRPTADPRGHVAGFADAAGRFLPLVCTLNATRVTDTVASWLAVDARGLSELALTANPDEDPPVLVPYFDGERTPNLPDAAGRFLGLRTTTTRSAIARAAHDGVLCGLLAGLDALADCGVDVGGRLLLIGGGARSAAYQQRCADLRGDEVVVPDSDEAVASGAAVQAAAVHDSRSTDGVALDWGLGRGPTIEPRSDGRGAEARAAYIAATENHS